MAALGSSRDNPLLLPGGPFTPAQRTEMEKSFLASNLPVGSVGNSGFEWRWVETRTFPDTGRTYDIVGLKMWDAGNVTNNEFWFDVTSMLTPAERGPLVTRALTTPPVKPSAGAIRPAGQADSSSTGLIATLVILGALAGFTVLEYYSRPAARQLSPVRRRRRKSVMMPI